MQNGDDLPMRRAEGGWPMSAAGLVASEEVPNETFLVIEMARAGEGRYGTEPEAFYPTPKFTVWSN